MKLEEKMFPINLKGTAKVLEIYGFGIVEYSARGKSARMIALRDQAYYVTGSTHDFCIIYSQGIHTSELYRGTFIGNCHDENDIYAELNFEGVKSRLE